MKKIICILLSILGLLMGSSCTNKKTNLVVPDATAVDSEPHDAAFKESTYLLYMDDLKAINLAANFLKELGETVAYQETYIEFHEAQEAAVHITLAEGKAVEYTGDYLEVRFYNSEDPEVEVCENCTVVYISQDGKILGQNKFFPDDLIQDEDQQNEETQEEQQNNKGA